MDRTLQSSEVDRNYDVFRRNLAAYLAQHRGSYVLMKAGEAIEFFEKPGDAYLEGLKRFEDGLFSIQEVTDEPIDLGFFSHVGA